MTFPRFPYHPPLLHPQATAEATTTTAALITKQSSSCLRNKNETNNLQKYHVGTPARPTRDDCKAQRHRIRCPYCILASYSAVAVVATKTSQLPDQQTILLPLLRLHFILRRDRHRPSHTQLMGRRSLNNNTQSPDSIIIIIIIGSLARRFNCVLVEETCRECHRSFCYFLCLRFAPTTISYLYVTLRYRPSY